MKKVLVIVGPTAVGKTALSVQLAEKLNGEIISGDSMQVYKQLDIGTAKATVDEQKGIPHYLIDCRELDETYSAADFQQEGRKYIDEISGKGKLPIVAGGTGLYIQALVYDFQLGGKEDAQSAATRKKYEQLAEEKGNEALWEQLNRVDPIAGAAIHFNNRKKLIRALEVFEATGASILSPKEQPKQLYDYFMIGLETERSLLYDRINQRVELMMEQGLLAEAETMFRHSKAQAAQGIGYKEFFPYFSKQISLDEAVEQVKQNSRRYAKRQLTWFKNRMDAHWVDLLEQPEELAVLEQKIEKWLKE